jgi:hypothetical protein
MHDANNTTLPASLWPRTRHLAIPPSFSRCVIRLQDSRLRLISLREGIAALLAHTLHLADFANSLLELFHTRSLLLVTIGHSSGGSIPRSIILNVVFLNFLNVMVLLWVVHSFCTLTC